MRSENLFLQHLSGPAATQLLTSNLWEFTIFPKKIVDNLNTSGAQCRDLGYMLKLSNPVDYSHRNNSKSSNKVHDRSQRKEEYRENKSNSRHQQSFQKNTWKKAYNSKDQNTKPKSSKTEYSNKKESTDNKNKSGFYKKQNSSGTSGSEGNKKQRK